MRRDVVSFGRRDGRASRRLLDPADPQLAGYLVQPPRGARATSVDPGWRFDPVAVFGRVADLVVEVGTGTGEALLAAAGADPAADYLGIEVYRPGLARTVRAARRAGLTNVRLVEADARAVVATALPAASVTEARVFFPDPWPKLRHHKRRLVDGQFLADLARALRPGGLIWVVTDWTDYATAIRRAAAEQPALAELPAAALVTRARRRAVTKFERRAARDGRPVSPVWFRRV